MEVGGGLDHLTVALLERELGHASMALSVFWGRPSGILMGCEGEQRERYPLPAARGERFDALALTEPGAGSDVRGMQCFARHDGGDWVVNGAKHFISHADLADFVIVFVATGEEEIARGPKKRITCFLVDRGTPGFEIRSGYDSVSHRGYHNCILTGMGLMSDLPLARFWRDARVERIWDGTSEIQRHIIGRGLLRPPGARAERGTWPAAKTAPSLAEGLRPLGA